MLRIFIDNIDTKTPKNKNKNTKAQNWYHPKDLLAKNYLWLNNWKGSLFSKGAKDGKSARPFPVLIVSACNSQICNFAS